MNSDSHGKVVQELFFEFLEAEHVDLEAEFEAFCGAHPEHAEELHRLRGAHDKVHRDLLVFGELRAERGPSSSPQGASPGDQIGDFQLVRAIARGGMGEIWEAEQGSLRRRVALKLVRPDRVHDNSMELFAREARAGGRLSHPGIVAVYGYGEDSGRQWIAQELVEGALTLRDFIENARARERLPESYYAGVTAFMIELASALHAAHEARIIHRDIKPQNVLVTPENRPKLTDFGLARISDETALSASGDVGGTWLYMSPEQILAKRAQIDHRTDIFSLGVVMFELLALQRPFEGDSSHQIAQAILHRDPPDLRKLRSRVPRDLSVICAKALEKRPADRYASMADLEEDLRRYTRNLPIHAKPPTALERIGKWVRRNPTKSVAAGIAALAFGIITTLALHIFGQNEDLRVERATLARTNADLAQEKQRVIEERDRLGEVSRFQGSLFTLLEPDSLGQELRSELLSQHRSHLRLQGVAEADVAGRTRQLEGQLAPVNFTSLAAEALRGQILERARRRVRTRFKHAPQVQAILRGSLAEAYSELGFEREAAALLREAYEQTRDLEGEQHEDTLALMISLGSALEHLDELDEARDLFERALELQVEDGTLGIAEEVGMLHALGRIHEGLQDVPRAQEYFEEAHRLSLEALGPNHIQTIGLLDSLAGSSLRRGDEDEALRLMRLVRERSGRVHGENTENSLVYENNLGQMLRQRGEFEEAQGVYAAALARARAELGDQHSVTQVLASNLGELYLTIGELEPALPLLEESLAVNREQLGPYHSETLRVASTLATALATAHREEEALPYARESYERRLERLGPRHKDTLSSGNNLAGTLFRLGHMEEAVTLFEALLETAVEEQGADSADALFYAGNLGFALTKAGRLERALPLLRNAYEVSREKRGKYSEDTLMLQSHLATALVAHDDLREGLKLYEDAHKRARRKLPDGHATSRYVRQELRALYQRLHALEPGAGWDERARSRDLGMPEGSEGE